MCTSFQIEGDVVGIDRELKMEGVELWHRNPVECIEELIGNPAFKGKQFYTLKGVYHMIEMKTGQIASTVRCGGVIGGGLCRIVTDSYYMGMN